jgi:hypothetical protein
MLLAQIDYDALSQSGLNKLLAILIVAYVLAAICLQVEVCCEWVTRRTPLYPEHDTNVTSGVETLTDTEYRGKECSEEIERVIHKWSVRRQCDNVLARVFKK